MRQKAALHRIGEDATQASVDTLNGAFGERLSRYRILLLSQFSVEISEMFGLKVGQFVAAQKRHEAVDVLLVPGQSGFCQLGGGNLLQPQFGVGREGDCLVHFQRFVFALALEESGLQERRFKATMLIRHGRRRKSPLGEGADDKKAPSVS